MVITSFLTSPADAPVLALVTTVHIAALLLLVHQQTQGLRNLSLLLPSLVFSASSWMLPSPAGLAAGLLLHIGWFISCRRFLPTTTAQGPASMRSKTTPSRSVAHPLKTAATPKPPTGFVQVPVIGVFPETEDITTFRMARPEGFSFSSGQFTSVRVNIDGEPVVRCYSISSAPEAAGYFEISVKRQGLMSVTLYQALQYDAEGPAGLGKSDLSYLFGNLRWRISKIFEIQGTYHRGQSVDARTITDDVINGRPVNPSKLDGLLFESARGRLMVRPLRWLSVWAGFANDRNNRGDEASNRLQLGVSARRLFGIPLDVTVASSQTSRGEDSYDSLWASVGYSVGPKLYLSLDYNDTLSVYHLGDGDGGTIEVRPNSERLSLSGNININRTFSLLITIEHTDHSDFTETRALTGLIVRF